MNKGNTMIDKLKGGVLVALFSTLLLSGQAMAASVTVSSSPSNNPANPILNNTSANLAAGAYVQIILSTDNATSAPSQTTGLPTSGTDTVASTGTLSAPGTFSKGGVSIPTGQYCYLVAWETWNGVGTPTGRYGLSALSPVMSSPTYIFRPASFATTININPPGTLQFSSATYSVGETGPTVTITVTRTGGSGGAVGVTYATSNGTATSGTDYTAATSQLSWNDGDAASKTFSVSITNDVLDENNETVNLALSSPTGGATLGTPNTAVLTITDDDNPPTVGFTSASQTSAGESGTMVVTAQLSAASGLAVTVPYAVSGTATGADYTITTSPITIAAGQTTGTATITITGDTVDEDDETVIVTMGTPTNATAAGTTVHTATIADDDIPPTVQFSAASSSGSEGTSPANLAVTLSAASGKTVTVNYSVSGGTATGSGVDYTLASGTTTFTPGQTSRNISATIVDDAAIEAAETIIVTLASPTNATLGSTTTHTYTINDNDTPGAPTITSVTTKDSTDTSGYVYETLDIKGTNFGSLQGSSIVELRFQGGSYATLAPASIYFWSATKVQIGIPKNIGTNYATAGTMDVRLTVSSQQATGNFTLKPKVYSVTPNSGPVNTTVKIEGTAFHGTAGSNSIGFNGTSAVGTKITQGTSNDTLEVVVPANATTGPLLVTVNSQSSNAKYDWSPFDSVTFTVTSPSSPAISGIAPNSGNQGDTQNVTITGTNTAWSGDMKSAVQFSGSGITINSATATDATHISASITLAANAATGARTVTVTGASGSATFTVNTASSGPTITTTSLPGGTVGTAYNQLLAATGGTSPYTWSITTGALPVGLTLNASTGAISGTPTAVEVANFTVQVADSSAQIDTQALAITVTAAAPAPTSIIIDDFEGGSVGTWQNPNPNSGYYTFGNGMMTPDSSKITAQGPDGSAAKNGTKGMKVRFSYLANSDPSKDWGDGWGAALVKTLDLSAMKSVTMNINWDGSANYFKFGFKDSAGHVYVATVTNAALTSVSGYGPLAIPATSFSEDTGDTSRTPGAIDWTKITNYNFAYLNKGTTTNYQSIDDITALTTDEAVISPPSGDAPAITSISPEAAPAGTTITVTGLRFGNSMGGSHLDFENVSTKTTYPAQVIAWSDTSLTAYVPQLAAAGAYEVKVVRVAIATGTGTVTALQSNPANFQVTASGAGDTAVIWPNPFNPNSQTVNLAVTNTGGAAKLGFYIFDMTARLVHKTVITSGNQTSWNGRDQSAALVADGAYLLRAINEDTKTLLAKGKILVIKR